MAGTKDYADFTLTHVILSSSSLKRRQGERRTDPGIRCPEIRTGERTAQEKHTRRFPYKFRPEPFSEVSGCRKCGKHLRTLCMVDAERELYFKSAGFSLSFRGGAKPFQGRSPSRERFYGMYSKSIFRSEAQNS